MNIKVLQKKKETVDAETNTEAGLLTQYLIKFQLLFLFCETLIYINKFL